MQHNQCGKCDEASAQAGYTNQQQLQQYSDYYSYGYNYPSYQQTDQRQQPVYGSSYSYPAPPPPPPPPPPAPPAPPSGTGSASEAPPPPPATEPPPPGTAEQSKDTKPNYNYSSASATPAVQTVTMTASTSTNQPATNYSSTYWTTPTSTTAAYWGNPSSNWSYSNWYQVGQAQSQESGHQQTQQTYYSNSAPCSVATTQQYSYAQYSNAGGVGHGWSQATHNPSSWGWSGQQQYQQTQQYQWGNQQWGGAMQPGGGASQPGSEAWAGNGWTQMPPQHPNYQGYYGQPHNQQQRQYQYDINYQGHSPGNQVTHTPQSPSGGQPRSPGTPPLQELLSPGSCETTNDRGTPSSRKHQSSCGEGEPDSKRQRQDHQWQSHDKYPPMKRILLPTPPPSYNTAPSPDGHGSKHTPAPSTPHQGSQPTAQGQGTQDESSTKNKKGKFPPGFSTYVNRAFAACSTAEEREKVHEYLDVELNKVFNENRQWAIDWESYPLPRFLLANKRPASRWDTPSPAKELIGRGSPLQPGPAMTGVDNDSGDEDVLPLAFGRGRGKRRKKNKGKKGKNKGFFIDNQPAFTVSAEDKQRMSLRTQRFGKQGPTEENKNIYKKLSVNELLKSANVGGSEEAGMAWEDRTLEGTSQALEKQYLRLTSAPDPSTVRPLTVLKKAYDHVMSKWQSSGDYHYTCEQFKSIRQDLTLQKIRDKFAVLVYETHARIALRKSDRGEFNQCQTQLKALYHDGVPGSQAEFIAYRILYLILTDNTAEISSMLKELSSDLRHAPCVEHALRVHYAWFLNNYHQFFKLYRSAPNLSGALIDMFVERERKAALKSMTKAYVHVQE